MRHPVLQKVWAPLAVALLTAIGIAACGDENATGSDATLGGEATGGNATGGNATGGEATGGEATGGSATGGSATGGSATGGSATGGANEAGVSSEGGAATGGRATGGATAGGSPAGGAPAGGVPAGGSPVGGALAGAPAGGSGGLECEQVDCLRVIECVEDCGGAIVTRGCCPCPEGTFDSIECGNGGAGGGTTPNNGGVGTGGVGTGGVGTGGVGTGGVGGVPVACEFGCTPMSECDEGGILWECEGRYDFEAMLDAGCVDLVTGIQRFCCPLTAFVECLPRIAIDRDVYAQEEQIGPRWENPTHESIFLPGCGTVELERRSGEAWEHLGPVVLCGWEGVAVEVRPRTSYVDPAAMIIGAGTYRLTGGYSVGCTPGEALSTAGCRRGPIPVVSRAFTVE